MLVNDILVFYNINGIFKSLKEFFESKLLIVYIFVYFYFKRWYLDVLESFFYFFEGGRRFWIYVWVFVVFFSFVGFVGNDVFFLVG